MIDIKWAGCGQHQPDIIPGGPTGGDGVTVFNYARADRCGHGQDESSIQCMSFRKICMILPVAVSLKALELLGRSS